MPYVWGQAQGRRKVVYYEFVCPECGHRFTVSKPIARAAEAQDCLECFNEAQRVYSPAIIHMNEWVAEGYRRTNEPPEENKPGIKKLQEERAGGDIVSYPGAAAHRERGLQ